ncbi:hypothetical protein DL95DRAFT_73055 [Leptodontidium sp. 2 PMI_412]|nr:hypothetical protein DL95DRAFT_73055 [Leptodontidium sp. 2 PMI_412]
MYRIKFVGLGIRYVGSWRKMYLSHVWVRFWFWIRLCRYTKRTRRNILERQFQIYCLGGHNSSEFCKSAFILECFLPNKKKWLLQSHV